MFTTFFLQDIFIQELENLFKDDRFPGKNGDKVKLNVFKQFLPIRESIYSEETEGSILDASPLNEENFPYIMVVLLDGTFPLSKADDIALVVCQQLHLNVL